VKNWLTDFLNAIQLPPRFLFAAAALGLLFLLMPVSWVQWLRIETVLAEGRGWIALGTSCAFFFGTAQLFPLIARWWRRRIAIRQTVESLDSLSEDERMLLGYCAYKKRRTLFLQLTSAEANCAHGLCQKGLMEEASGGGSILGWPYTIPSDVWPHIVSRIDFFLGKNWEKDATVLKRIDNLDKKTSAQRSGHDF